MYDSQAILSCSRGETFGFYYKSKLSIYNFTIGNLRSNKDVKRYVWSKGQSSGAEL